MEDRDYQARAAAWLAKRKRGLLVAPAGSGKTLMAARALSDVLTMVARTRKAKIGWICGTIEQRDQAVKSMAQFDHIATLAEVSVACAQAETDWSDRDVIVVDEAHHLPAKSWFAQVDKFTGCLWGLTATPWSQNDSERNRVLREVFAGEVFVVHREEVAYKMAPAKVVMVDVAVEGLAELVEGEFCKKMRRWDAKSTRFKLCPRDQAMIRIRSRAAIDLGIVANSKRTDKAIEIARRHADESTIVLVPEVDMAFAVSERIPGSVPCYSGMPGRKVAIDKFRSGAIRCVVATSLLDEGFDAPIAGVLIMLSGGRSASKTIQRTGRVLRQHPGKECGLIYDFLDASCPTLHNQAKARMKVYRELGYQVSMAERATA